jgi:hypothetical protein
VNNINIIKLGEEIKIHVSLRFIADYPPLLKEFKENTAQALKLM